MRTLASALISACALAVGLSAPAQVPVQQLTYRGFSVVRQADLEPTLNRYSAGGYRLVAIAAEPGGNVLAVMEQLPPQSPVREYRALFGGWAHLRGLHNEIPIVLQMNEAGAQGYRFFPASVVFESGAAAAVVMEKDLDPAARYAYRVFSPQFETAHRFEQDALQGEAEGFHVVFHGSAGRGPSTLMEKRTDSPVSVDPGSNRFRTLPAKDISRKLQEQVNEGYVPMRSSVWLDINTIQHALWFQKSRAADLRLVNYEAEFHQREANPDSGAGEFVQKLNEAAAQGYRIVAPPVRISYVKPAFRVHWIASFNGVMLRSPGAPPVTYRYLVGLSLPELVSQMNDAAAEGFRVVPDSLGHDGSILLERVQAERVQAAVSGGGAP